MYILNVRLLVHLSDIKFRQLGVNIDAPLVIKALALETNT